MNKAEGVGVVVVLSAIAGIAYAVGDWEGGEGQG